jgi:tetratricopeptide (TPR) repeat protein
MKPPTDSDMKSFFKKALVFSLAMAVVAMAGWFGRKAYRKSSERRLIAKAVQYLEQKDFRNTTLCLQRALQINPMSLESCRIMGDMLDSAGMPASLGWRIRAARLQPENVTNLFVWAQTALKFKDSGSAAEALRSVDEKQKGTATYHKLAGALAWYAGRPDEAEKNYSEASRLEPSNASITLNLNTIRLASTNAEISRTARIALEQVTSDASLRSAALHTLLADAAGRRALAEAFKYSQQIVQDPSAAFSDKVDYLKLCRQTTNENYAAWRTSLERDAENSPEHAFALGQWVVQTEGPENGLRWLRALPQKIQTNQMMPLIVTDCLMALKDWKGILEQTQSQNWGEAEFYRLALESLAQRSLGQVRAADSSWRKSLRLAEHRLDRLSHLAQVVGAWGWKSERLETLSQIITEFPGENWAIDELATPLYAEGKTRELQELYLKIYSADPSNARLKNNLANLAMLQKRDLPNAYRMAQEAYETSTSDPFFASTYAYSLFLQKKTGEALKVLDGIKPEYLQIPSVAAYYGVIQGQAGRRDAAREPLKRAEAAKLLPEEKEIVRLAAAELH